MFIKFLFCLILILTGCQSTALDEYHKMGCTLLINLCKDLHEVQTLEELKQKAPKLKKKMRRLTELMIEADQYHRKHPEEHLIGSNSEISDRLRYEMHRICEEIEGAQIVLEQLQEEILDQLDLYERKKKAAI